MIKDAKMSGIEILLNDSRGVYIPQNFAENFIMSDWGVADDTRDILLAGPTSENEWYWEAWEQVLNNASYVDAGLNTWRLWQEGDLFAYCVELMSDQEYADFFGTERESED